MPINPTNLPIKTYLKKITRKAHKAICVHVCLCVCVFSKNFK